MWKVKYGKWNKVTKMFKGIIKVSQSHPNKSSPAPWNLLLLYNDFCLILIIPKFICVILNQVWNNSWFPKEILTIIFVSGPLFVLILAFYHGIQTGWYQALLLSHFHTPSWVCHLALNFDMLNYVFNFICGSIRSDIQH